MSASRKVHHGNPGETCPTSTVGPRSSCTVSANNIGLGIRATHHQGETRQKKPSSSFTSCLEVIISRSRKYILNTQRVRQHCCPCCYLLIETRRWFKDGRRWDVFPIGNPSKDGATQLSALLRMTSCAVQVKDDMAGNSVSLAFTNTSVQSGLTLYV